MSTRKQRHEGNSHRGYADLNRSHGINGRMESETWYIALIAVHAKAYETAKDVLIEHFGSLDLARRSFDSIEEQVARRYQEVIDLVA